MAAGVALCPIGDPSSCFLMERWARSPSYRSQRTERQSARVQSGEPRALPWGSDLAISLAAKLPE